MAQKAFEGAPLYVGYSYRKPMMVDLIHDLQAAIQRYGLKLVVFDNLHYLCRSLANQTQEVSLAVQEFKFLAQEMEIPVILIAQPRKIQPNTMMTAMDLKDSVSIFSDCDHLIILHRNRVASQGADLHAKMVPHDMAYDPVTLVRVEASRYSQGGEALLHFHGECSWFEEIQQPVKGIH
jgi:replicative DNA helicase